MLVWSTISLAVAFLALADLVVQVRDLRGRLQNLEHSRGADRRHRDDLEDQSREGVAGAGQSEVIIAGAVRACRPDPRCTFLKSTGCRRQAADH